MLAALHTQHTYTTHTSLSKIIHCLLKLLCWQWFALLASKTLFKILQENSVMLCNYDSANCRQGVFKSTMNNYVRSGSPGIVLNGQCKIIYIVGVREERTLPDCKRCRQKRGYTKKKKNVAT